MACAIPFGLIGSIWSVPLIALAGVYFWAVFRPELLPPYAVFGIGVSHDLVSGGPVGLWALTYLTVYAVALSQRGFLFTAPFIGLWLGFGVAALAAAIIAWMVASFYFSMFVQIEPLLLQAFATWAIYPPLSRIFSNIQRRIAMAG